MVSVDKWGSFFGAKVRGFSVRCFVENLEFKNAWGVDCGQGNDGRRTSMRAELGSDSGGVGGVESKPRDLGNDRGYRVVASRKILVKTQ
jgi:hypothetical protein